MSPLHTTLVLTLLFSAVPAYCQRTYQGFNSGNTFPDRTAKAEDDFFKEFSNMQQLHNTPGLFNSVRLYTNIQAETQSTPLSAFPAALRTNTSMLLGIWCSGTTNITNELDALSTALDQYGTAFADAVMAISVGSEDLYRASESGVINEAGIGTGPDQIVDFIRDVRRAINGTLLADKPVGHVDTWTAWINESNANVINEVDWIGVDVYPFFEADKNNTFANAVPIFDDLLNVTLTAAGDKPVWLTETGWPFSGPDWDKAEASLDNLQSYWQQIGCSKLFGRMNTWWYTLRDANPDNKVKFGIADDDMSTTPRIDLTCPAGSGAPATINVNAVKTSAGSVSATTETTLRMIGLGVLMVLFLV